VFGQVCNLSVKKYSLTKEGEKLKDEKKTYPVSAAGRISIER